MKVGLTLLGVVVALALLLEFVLPLFLDSVSVSYIIQPACWLGLALYVRRLPRVRLLVRRSLRRELVLLGVMIGFFQVVMLAIGGLFADFGRSPYSFTPFGIVRNVVFVGTMLVGMEYARAYLAGSLARKRPLFALALIAIVFTVIDVTVSRFTTLGEPLPTVTFLGSTLLPSLASHLLATLLAWLGGPLPAIAYRAIPLAFEWFSPVLPDLTWGIEAALGTMIPVLGFMAVYSVAAGQIPQAGRRPRREDTGSPLAWSLTAVALFVLFWFSLGLLPLYPASVAGASMEPVFSVGDMVIAVKVEAANVNDGDIIVFSDGETRVIHRVIGIIEARGERQFVTQGDANSVPDSAPVHEMQLQGKVLNSIPKMGWLSLFLRSS